MKRIGYRIIKRFLYNAKNSDMLYTSLSFEIKCIKLDKAGEMFLNPSLTYPLSLIYDFHNNSYCWLLKTHK